MSSELTGASPAAARCLVHPARPAVDTCPVCGRPRCAPDVRELGGRGCGACLSSAAVRTRPPAGARELLVRAGLAGMVVALFGGFVATQYVGTRDFSLVVPGLVGLAAAWAVFAASGSLRRTRRSALYAVAGLSGLLGTALGFRLVPGGQSLVTPLGDVGPPYLAALVGVAAWPLVFGPPGGRSRRRQPDGRGSDS